MRRNALALVALAGLVGCGPGGPRTYPVNGTVELAGGEVSALAGHHIEAVLDGDPAVRAAGVIAPDGSFVLETLDAGLVLQGAREGRYKARLLPAEEDADGRKLRKPPVAAKYLRFETSGLSFEVPAKGTVAVRLSAR